MIRPTLEQLRPMIGYLHAHDRARFFRLWSKRAFLRRAAWANIVISGKVSL